MDVMLLAGTSAEAVKLAPLAMVLEGHGVLRPVVVHCGHPDCGADHTLAPFGLAVDTWLSVPPRSGDRQAELLASLLPALDEVFRRHRPAALVITGDTTTALAGALAAFWARIPVVHLDAGLLLHDLDPFPHESVRQMVARIAALHLAPTTAAGAALRAEGVPRQRITIVGNTAVDSVTYLAERDLPARCPELALLEMEVTEAGQRLVLVIWQSRESWAEALDRTLSAVRRLVEEHYDVQVLFPIAPNPALREQVVGGVGDLARVTITEPLDYPDLVRALRLSSLVLTDSDGVQEEAPAFAAPVLVLRDYTQRREAIEAGFAWLVGTDSDTIHIAATEVLIGHRQVSTAENPYGDGNAAARSVIALEDLLGIAEGHFSTWETLP